MAYLYDDGAEVVARKPSSFGKYFIAVMAVLMVGWIIYARFFSPRTVHVAQASTVPLSRGENKPLVIPAEKPPDPMPQPNHAPTPKPVSLPAVAPRPAAPKQESEEQKMQRKVRLTAHYAHPTVVGTGSEGGRMMQQQSQTDVASMQQPGQVKEIPAVYNQGGSRGNSGHYGNGDVWNHDFSQRGAGQVGVVQHATSPFVIQRGWKIFARLDDPINTDTPGQITATVIQDVMDSATGRYKLIPAGSKLIGGYDTVMRDGQSQLPSAWDQLNFPNGDWMSLAAMPGAETSGVAGLPIEVNNHLWARAGRSLLLTLSGAASEYAIRNSVSSMGSYGLEDALARQGGRELQQGSWQVLQRGRQQGPTGTAESGGIFVVQVTQKLEFPGPYRDETLYADTDQD